MLHSPFFRKDNLASIISMLYSSSFTLRNSEHSETGLYPRFEVKKTSGHCGVLGNELADAKATGDQTKFKKIFKRFEERLIS